MFRGLGGGWVPLEPLLLLFTFRSILEPVFQTVFLKMSLLVIAPRYPRLGSGGLGTPIVLLVMKFCVWPPILVTRSGHQIRPPIMATRSGHPFWPPILTTHSGHPFGHPFWPPILATQSGHPFWPPYLATISDLMSKSYIPWGGGLFQTLHSHDRITVK